jgi:mannan endo-1,4-beta-mannosidase
MGRRYLIILSAVSVLVLASAVGLGWLAFGGGTANPAGPASIQAPAATRLPTRNAAEEGGFVSAADGRFLLAGRPYYFVGTNFWQGMNLAVDGRKGNRALLEKELDRLQRLGITNLRIMASSEGPDTEPYRMTPALMTEPGAYDESVLDGLDYLLAEMGKRGLRAVMVLNNFWYWSGGMAQYVSWRDGTDIPYPGDWGNYMTYSGRFYYCQECQTWYRDHIRMLITRVNPYTGKAYRDDPAVFSWELGNEPRLYPLDWVYDTAAFIKSLDSNHMVTTGSEGALPDGTQNFTSTHSSPDIDYATIHIWPQNWGWYNPADSGSFTSALARAHLYFANAERDCVKMNKPLVLEEFGLARDYEPLLNIYEVGSPTTNRDAFYAAMFGQVFASMSAGGPAGGDNFWAWSGESRPGSDWVGDPPHETPGWYSVYDIDQSTLAVIAAHVAEVKGL